MKKQLHREAIMAIKPYVPGNRWRKWKGAWDHRCHKTRFNENLLGSRRRLNTAENSGKGLPVSGRQLLVT